MRMRIIDASKRQNRLDDSIDKEVFMSNATEQLNRRDTLAGMVMQALITKGGNASRYELAEYAVKQTDLLIKEFDKKQA